MLIVKSFGFIPIKFYFNISELKNIIDVLTILLQKDWDIQVCLLGRQYALSGLIFFNIFMINYFFQKYIIDKKVILHSLKEFFIILEKFFKQNLTQ